MNELLKKTEHGKIIELAINRPHVYNALNLDVLKLLSDELMFLASDDRVNGVIIKGYGKAFCAGGDLKWVAQFSGGHEAALCMLASQLHLSIMAIRKMRKPVIAAINGIAAGAGFSLSLACDFRVMEKSAVLKQSYTSNGLSIDGGGTFMLPRLVGIARALEIAAFDEPITSDLAWNLGLITKGVEDGDSLKEAIHIIERISKKSLHSFGWSKRLLNASSNMTLASQLDMECEGICDCGKNAGGQEGIQAFLEKRKPVFNI